MLFDRMTLMKFFALSLFLFLFLAGCVSFDVTRRASYVNMDNERLHAEFGEKVHTETFRGMDFTFKGIVRVRLQDGNSVVCLQTVSTAGMEYISKDKRYLFVERGPFCILFKDGVRVFEGFYCRDSKKK